MPTWLPFAYVIGAALLFVGIQWGLKVLGARERDVVEQGALRKELTTDVSGLRREYQHDLNRIQEKLNDEIATRSKDSVGERDRMNSELAKLEALVREMKSDLQESRKDQGKRIESVDRDLRERIIKLETAAIWQRRATGVVGVPITKNESGETSDG